MKTQTAADMHNQLLFIDSGLETARKTETGSEKKLKCLETLLKATVSSTQL